MKPALLLILVLLLTACPRLSGPSVRITVGSLDLEPGQSISLSASIRGLETATGLTFRWTLTEGELSSEVGESVTFTAPEYSAVIRISASVVDRPDIAPAVLRLYVVERRSFRTASSAIAQGTITRDRPRLYRLDIPPSQDSDLLFIETESSGNLQLSLWNAQHQPVRTSTSPRSFSALNLESSAISEAKICRGPCVVVRNPNRGQGSVLYAFLETETLSQTYRLYAFGDDFQDVTEPDNDSCVRVDAELQGQISVTPVFEHVGAIETVGDRDCFETIDLVSYISLRSLPETSIAIQADIYELGALFPWHSLEVGPGEDLSELTFSPARPVRVIVRAGGQVAAPSFHSRYVLAF